MGKDGNSSGTSFFGGAADTFKIPERSTPEAELALPEAPFRTVAAHKGARMVQNWKKLENFVLTCSS